MFKKKIALFTALMISASMAAAIPSVAYADTASSSKTSSSQKEDAGMKAALTLVKSRIDIPSEYSKFSYSTSDSYGLKSYTFTWKKPDGSYESYSATVKGGVITRYYSPSKYSSSVSISPFTNEQFKSKALDWINKVNPEAKGNVELKSGPNLWLRSSSVDMSFYRTKDGVRVQKNNISINLDKMTGEVTSYSCDWWENAQLKDPAKAVSQETIQKTYSNEVTLKPWYRLKYDYKTKKTTAKIVYEPQSSFVYDAFTGKHSTMDEDYAALMDTDKYFDYGEAIDGEGDTIDDAVTEEAAMATDGGGVELSAEEIAALEEMNGLLKEDEFRKLMIADPYIDLTDKYLTESYRIAASDDMPSGYMIHSTFVINNSKEYRRYYINADAKSGKVDSFSCSGDFDSKALLNVTKANELAEAAAQYYYGSIWSKYKADPDNTAPAVKTEKYTDTSRTMVYYRYENNIQVTGQYINVTVNSDGKVTDVHHNHTKGVDFGDGKIISQSAALEQLFKQKQFDLNFDGFRDLKSTPHTYLHYTLSSWTVNAKTGKLCDYFGDNLSEKNKTPEECPYTDIKDSPYKNEIITLYNHGVKVFTSEKLQPKAAVTKGELQTLLDYIGYGTRINESQKNARAKRIDLAKQFTAMKGIDDCAGYKGIFKSPFKDISDDNADIGYIALAYGMGAVDGDENGNFKPNEYVTREYAMHCLYNYIMKNPEKANEYPVMPLEAVVYADVAYEDVIDE